MQMKALHRRETLFNFFFPNCGFDKPECGLKTLVKIKPDTIHLDQMVNYQQRKTDFIWAKIQEIFIMSVLSEAMRNEF